MHSALMRLCGEIHDSGDSASGNVSGVAGQDKLEQKRAKRRSARMANLRARIGVKSSRVGSLRN